MARILILHTGGTLGMRPREPDRALAAEEIGPTLIENVPELAELADVETRVICNRDSSDLDSGVWRRLADEIAGCIDAGGIDGVVVTHGTDTMAYTASALSFLLRDLPLPVVLTGSQRPLADARSDGRANLVGAVDFARRDVREVGIYFDGMLLRGNRATKRSSFAFRAFDSPNFPPLAELGTSVMHHAPALEPAGPFRRLGDFDERVAVLRVVPGTSPVPFESLVDTDLRGLILVAFGAGNVPSNDARLERALGRLVEKGVSIAVTSQSSQGAVDLGRYVGGRLLQEIGAFGTGDMTIEAATVKLMYLLAGEEIAARVKTTMRIPLAGEVSIPS